MSKPTILLVPGAYHTAESFNLIIPKLEALSYPLATAQLASLGKDNPTSTYVDDVDAIHKVLLPILESGKQVVIVAHSWGAIPAAASVEGQSIEERSARGEKGGIKSLLLIAGSVITKRGVSLAEENYGNAAPEDAVNYVDIAAPLVFANENARDMFYHDLTTSQADHYFSLLQPHALNPLVTPVNFILDDVKVEKMYLVTEADKILPVAKQESFLKKVAELKSVRCGEGHSPFLSKPDWTVEVIDGFASGKRVEDEPSRKA